MGKNKHERAILIIVIVGGLLSVIGLFTLTGPGNGN